MSGTMSSQGGLTRRSFLKTTGAVAGATALCGLATPSLTALAQQSVSGQDEDRAVFNQCRTGCVTGCPLNVHVRDGKVVKVEPAETPDSCYKRACLRGLSHIQVLYSPNRVKYPMKQMGERGSDQWERISWEQAIDEIGGKLLEIKEKYGPRANAVMGNGGNTTLLCGPYGGFGRFKNGLELQPIDNCVDFGCMPALARVYGPGGSYGAAAEPADLENADTFFLWGMNLTHTNWDRWQHMMRAIDKGAKLVVIDPNFTPIASKADKFVSIRPASDAALIMAMINIGIEENLLDIPFIKKATVGPFLVREDNGKFLRMSDLGVEPKEGPVNPQTKKPTTINPAAVYDLSRNEAVATDTAVDIALEGSFEIEGFKVTTAFSLLAKRASAYTLEFAAEQTGATVEEIRELADLYFNGGTVANLLGFGTNAYDNAPYMGHAFATLVVLSGQIGKPGTNAAYNQTAFFSANPMFMFPDMKNLKTPSLPMLDLPELMEKGELELGVGKFTAPKTLYVAMQNPYNNFLNPQTWRDVVLPKLEMVVVVDRAFTDSARYMADYVLPAAHYFEGLDMRPNLVSAPYTAIAEQAIEPIHEAKTDFNIYKLLAERFGVGQYFDMTEEEAMAQAYSGDLQKLQTEKLVRYVEKGFQPYNYEAGLATPTGKFEFYCEMPLDRQGLPVAPEYFEDCCLPTFKEPTEAWPSAEGSEEFPFVLVSERIRGLLHSSFGDARWLREIHPGPFAKMNPFDAEARGLCDGDCIKIYNDRGYAVVKLVVTAGQRKGVITWPKGWEQKFYKEGNLHNLTPIAYNPITKNHSYCDCHVNVEKWEA